jgi:hypothetical protein
MLYAQIQVDEERDLMSLGIELLRISNQIGKKINAILPCHGK